MDKAGCINCNDTCHRCTCEIVDLRAEVEQLRKSLQVAEGEARHHHERYCEKVKEVERLELDLAKMTGNAELERLGVGRLKNLLLRTSVVLEGVQLQCDFDRDILREINELITSEQRRSRYG